LNLAEPDWVFQNVSIPQNFLPLLSNHIWVRLHLPGYRLFIDRNYKWDWTQMSNNFVLNNCTH
jgi:hypothetical protein